MFKHANTLPTYKTPIIKLSSYDAPNHLRLGGGGGGGWWVVGGGWWVVGGGWVGGWGNDHFHLTQELKA